MCPWRRDPSGDSRSRFQNSAELSPKGTAKLSWQNFECMPQQLAGPLMRTAIPRRPRLRATASDFSLPPRMRTGVEISSAGGASSGSIASLGLLSPKRCAVAQHEYAGTIGEQMFKQDFADTRPGPPPADQ